MTHRGTTYKVTALNQHQWIRRGVSVMILYVMLLCDIMLYVCLLCVYYVNGLDR